MHYARRFFLAVALLSPATCLLAQTHKPGLWEVTTHTIRSHRGDPEARFNGNSLAGGEAETATLPACYTRELIEGYRIVLPPSLRDCALLNVHRTPRSVAADLSCKGTFNGRGSLETTWTDEDHAAGKVHFASRSRGAHPVILQWAEEVTATYKGSDCGNVRPRSAPVKPARP